MCVYKGKVAVQTHGWTTGKRRGTDLIKKKNIMFIHEISYNKKLQRKKIKLT